MKIAESYEQIVHSYQTTRRYNLEDVNLQEGVSEKVIYKAEKCVFTAGEMNPDTRIKEQRYLGLLLPYLYSPAVCTEVPII
jgi:hypothetical protein